MLLQARKKRSNPWQNKSPAMLILSLGLTLANCTEIAKNMCQVKLIILQWQTVQMTKKCDVVFARDTCRVLLADVAPEGKAMGRLNEKFLSLK